MPWRKIYSHDAQGRTTDGNKDRLIEAVRSARNIKVASPGNDMAFTKVDLVGVMTGEVIAQVSAFYSDMPPGTGEIRFHAPFGYYISNLSTSGTCYDCETNLATGGSTVRGPHNWALDWFAED